MKRLEVSGAVRPIYGSLGVKRLNTVVCMLSVVVVVHSTSKNTHTRDAPQAQSDPNNMICCHTTTLSIYTFK